MATKHIECRVKDSKYIDNRIAIKELLYLVDHDIFENEDTDCSGGLFNQIDLTVQGYTAHINYFCPNTWEYVEEFVWTNIGFLIMSDELYKFPYYEELLNRATTVLGCSREDLDIL